MKKYQLLIVLMILASLPVRSFAQAVVKGIVYEDINRNNKKERNEKGIPDVAVSNGIEVVKTGANGEYELPASDDQIIFVIKPSDYQVPVNEFNQPQFYYIHKPKGSPELKYKGMPSTGKLPKSVDFALTPAEPKDSFKILVFGDPQPYTEEEVDFFRRGIISELINVKDVEFGISMGDLVGDNLDLHLPYIKAVEPVGIPWYNVIGNHDENYDVDADTLSDETFEKNFGPANYAFNYGMVHFIVLDDIIYPDPRDGKGYWGGFRKDQLKFIENDLRFVPKDHLVVLAFHIPISEPDGGDPFRDEDRDKLFELLQDYPYTLSMSAHTHIQRQDFFYPGDGWLQDGRHHHFNVGTTAGDWYSGQLNSEGIPVSTMRDGTPKGYAWLTFNKNQYRINYKVAGKPIDYQIEIFAPKLLEQNKRTSAGIYANFFMGSENDTVLCRIDNGEWKRMSYVRDYDPAYLNLLHEWDFTEELMDGRRPSNPEFCRHLWRIGIPANLEAGEHTIEVKARDMFGQTFTQTKTYRIASR
ncbi:MAG: calcineurin-like phosphoesterase C-terminal domain-containing protein [Mangrovibacterium sp.]